MTDSTFDTPVLFLIFNRPDTTQQVFQAIRAARPARLFVAADGPRTDRPGDPALCATTREIIGQVDWECEVSTLFREKNLGCRHAISSAIDWFFTHVEEGIILEDDCLPDTSFFPFCGQLLARYRNDERVMMISGTRRLKRQVVIPESYYFSRYYDIWGWATWKRAWSLYDIRMSRWPEYEKRGYLKEVYRHQRMVAHLRKMMQETYDQRLDTWDLQWGYTCIFNHGVSIIPNVNLVKNIGDTGIHTRSPGPYHALPTGRVTPETMVHPDAVCPRYDLDTLLFDDITRDETFFMDIFSHLCSLKKRYFDRRI